MNDLTSIINKLCYKEFTTVGLCVMLEAADFSKKERVHDWRNYVPDEIMNEWANLPFIAKQAIYLMAESKAVNEEWE
jgi:hypothetical protein